MKHRTSSNDTCTTHKRAHGPGGWSVAAKVLIIMIASLLLLSLRASITRADDPPVVPPVGSVFLPVVAQPSEVLPPRPGGDWTEEEKQQIKNIVKKAAKLEPLVEEDEVDEVVDTETIKVEDDDDYRYAYDKHDASKNIGDIYHLGLNDDIVWPGNLIWGKDAHNFVYIPVQIPRAPVTLSLSVESSPTTGPSITQEVADPKLSTVRQGISDLLKKAVQPGTKVAAQADYKLKQVYSESQLDMFVGADASYGGGSIKSRFDWNSTEKRNKIVVRYQQVYYSIDMDTPPSHAAFFDPTRTSVAKIGAAMPAGSMPMYVAGVKYGMMAVMLIETDISKENMETTLEAAYGSGDFESALEFGMSIREVMEQSSVKILVYGGSTKELKDLEEGFPGFKKVIEASSDFSQDTPGLPLVYKFRHLRDHTLGAITLTSQYTIVRPIQIRQRVKIDVEHFKENDCYDSPGSKCEKDRLFIYLKGLNRTSGSDPGQLVNIPTPYDGYFSYPDFTKIVDMGNPSSDGWQGKLIGIDKSHILTFNTKKPFDFSLAEIEFVGKVREYDGESGDEWCDGHLDLLGDEFFGKKLLFITGEVEGYYQLNITSLSSPNPPPSPFAGTPVSFEAYNKTNHYLYDEQSSIKLKENDGTPAFARYATFKKRPGLADPSDDELASFESVANPGYYLQRYLYVEGASPLICCKLRLDRYEPTTQFLQAASFRMVPGLADDDDDFVSLMANYDLPNYYIYHRNGELFLHPYDHNDSNFAADATFKEVEGLAK